MEKWKDIAGYEGMYRVSDNGRVQSMDRLVYGRFARGRVLTLSLDRRGYVVVGLWRDNVRETKRVHRLVAEAFLQNPLQLPEVNHKNEKKNDNSAENLEWCEKIYNVNCGTGVARMAEYKKKKVIQLMRSGQVVKLWDSIADASQTLSVDDSSIAKAAKGKAKSAGGYLWRYA